ncbi:hypothetical protein P7K49_018581 [Saguinus oedipus]|uniref:Uncharacterized protein n=1 Tax=Saguinus oedipus TaxID=9490 RepID=A0ABQ9V6E1_SAGOE|nr:hypothetical protein P7K49_018581 [Saguinus oedipus]
MPWVGFLYRDTLQSLESYLGSMVAFSSVGSIVSTPEESMHEGAVINTKEKEKKMSHPKSRKPRNAALQGPFSGRHRQREGDFPFALIMERHFEDNTLSSQRAKYHTAHPHDFFPSGLWMGGLSQVDTILEGAWWGNHMKHQHSHIFTGEHM